MSLRPAYQKYATNLLDWKEPRVLPDFDLSLFESNDGVPDRDGRSDPGWASDGFDDGGSMDASWGNHSSDYGSDVESDDGSDDCSDAESDGNDDGNGEIDEEFAVFQGLSAAELWQLRNNLACAPEDMPEKARLVLRINPKKISEEALRRLGALLSRAQSLNRARSK